MAAAFLWCSRLGRPRPRTSLLRPSPCNLKPPKIGNLYGFGNTEESYNIMILGNKRRGPLGTPFDPDTGEGHVEHRDGH